MTIRKLSASVLVSLVVLAFLMSNVNPVFAETYQVVNVMIAYDEELADTAGSVYWLSAEEFCRRITQSVSWRFEDTFKIMFRIIRYVFWDSNDSIADQPLLYECINETGFYSGMTYNTIPIDILIAFSDQHNEALGIAKYKLGAVLVLEEYDCWSWTQYTDNVLQHELTHLYADWLTEDLPLGSHHWIKPPKEGYDCVMNIYPVYISPELHDRPYGVTTENWCDECIDRIMTMKSKWGREQTVGGGPYYPIPYSKGEVKLEP